MCNMDNDDNYWNEFLNNGVTTICITMYQGIHISILARYQLYLQRKRVPKGSIVGSIKWSIFEALKSYVRLASPRAYEIFMFWIESRWILSHLEKKRLSRFKYECRFIRKEKITEKDIKMNAKVFQKIHEIRNHI